MSPRIDDLCDAILMGELDRFNELIDQGIDVNQLDEEGNPPILFAAALGDRAMLKKLLDAGADPNVRAREECEEAGEMAPGDGDGATTLIKKARAINSKQDLEILRMLADAGALVNAEDSAGRTALYHAIESGMGDPGAVEVLLSLGADPNIRDKNGVSPLMIARARLADPVVEDNMEPICRMLEEAGASTDGLDIVELTRAVDENDLSLVRALIARGTDINANGGAPLRLAALNGHLDMVAELLSAGADPDLREPDDFTPAMHAAYKGHLDVLKLLADAGADFSLEIPGIGSALDYARMGGHAEVAEYLAGTGVKERSFENERGIATTEINETALLVKAPVNRVTEAFARLHKAQSIERDIIDRPVRTTGLCFIVYQLTGHDWTIVQYAHTDWLSPGPGPRDAEELSRELQTEAIYYGTSKTVEAIGYAYYVKGACMERLDYYEDYSDYAEDPKEKTNLPPAPAADPAYALGIVFENDGLITCFTSEERSLAREYLKDPFSLADQFIWSKDAFVPGWSEGARCTRQAGETFSLAGWPANAFVGADLVCVR